MSFKISDKELLKKYDQIWKRTEKLLKIKFASTPVYDDDDDDDDDDEKHTKTKTKTCGDNIIINFRSKRIPKEKAPCKCLLKQRKSIILKHFWKNANMNKKE